ncbi:MAG: 2-polyprenylphenol hydroxylase [Firmicutes bacterium HGW-Firmicutes-12]|jgi:NAD(P)H-flavin reductase|nr:MAG: 2-polyprenylphenol hydroxylase [Firmicutes bacterium HGW-Firmicutes-12]
MLKILDCIDAGSEYCPCHLAETGECIMCSQLQGKTFCDCRSWKGVCIYQEFTNNRYQKREQRQSKLCHILHREEVSEELFILRIKTHKDMARELNVPGAYVFLRSSENADYYDTPMSVMKVDEHEGTITTALQIRGIKTKALKNLNEQIEVRGPYWNGIMGLKYIKGLRGSKVLLVARGVGQASALPVAKKLVISGNKVTVILDKGSSGIFTETYFNELGCNIVHKPLLEGKGFKIPQETLEYMKMRIQEDEIKLVFSGGSERLHEGIAEFLLSLQEKPYFTCSNDAKFCCGEGICGSCHIRLKDGSRIKTCKTQLNPFLLYEGRINL